MNEWEKLKWKTLDCLEEIPPTPGVYAVRSMRGGKPRVIGRAFRKDKSGILCFGRAGESPGLRRRLRSFCRAESGKKVSHAEGKRYHRLCYNTNGFPLKQLCIGWLPLRSEAEAHRRELAWFDEYECTFGELPPLNRKRG